MKSSRANSFLNVFILFVFLATLLGSALTVSPARAISLVVTKAFDSNDGTCDSDCSLREAIILANANGASSETITFAANYTITLSSQLPDVTTTIIINGKGKANTIIEASTCNPITLPGACTPATYRVFKVTDIGNLTLNNLAVRHGKASPQEGGGIYNDGALAVTNSSFTSNMAYRGGGIFNTASLAVTVTVTNTDFTSNSAYGGGGGIYNEGALTVTNSSFSGNASNYGGGIDNFSGVLTVTGSSFSSNPALYAGGGILTSSGSLSVSNSVFSDNSAGDQGGGILNYASTVIISISNSAFLSNHADYGGGIYNNASAGTLNIANSTFSGNTASASGGGIYNNDGGLIATNSTFAGNVASVVGGGIINYSTLTLTNNTLSGNSAVYGGGGIFNAAGLYLKNTILANSVGSGDCYNTSGDAIAANTNSLIETNGPSGNRCGTPAVTADPGLGPLANNGGATQTFAITATSSAYDAGNNAICTASPVNGLDQRGVARPQGAACDIGAFETANPRLMLKSIGQYDGWILESTETSAAGGTMDANATTFNLGDNAQDKQYRAILHFDTSSLPDTAVITRVTLRIKKQGLIGTDPFTVLGVLRVDMRKPSFGAIALALNDFQATAGKASVAVFGATPINDWYRAILNNAGRAYINRTGPTQFRLQFTTDDNNDNGNDFMKFFSGNASAAFRPQLIIEYYVP